MIWVFKTSPSLNALFKHFWRFSSQNPNLKTLLASSILPEQPWSKQCYQLDCGTQCWRLRTSPPKPNLPLLTWQLALKMFMLAQETSEEVKVLIFEKTSSRSALVELSTAAQQGFCNTRRIYFLFSITSHSWLSFLKMSLASFKRIVYCHHIKMIWLTLDLPLAESSFIVIQLL